MDSKQINNSNTKLDIVMHVDENLDDQNRLRIEHAMMNTSGINLAYFSDELLVIGYDPAKTNSSKILKLVEKQRLHARLVCRI